MGPGTAVVFYTDGLIERRNESIDVGLERLRSAVHVDTSNRVAHSVMGQLIGTDEPEDDVALLVVHTADAAA